MKLSSPERSGPAVKTDESKRAVTVLDSEFKAGAPNRSSAIHPGPELEVPPRDQAPRNAEWIVSRKD
jgi:hypothetical protein